MSAREDLKKARELVASCPGIVPQFARRPGARLVTEREHLRLCNLCRHEGRPYHSQGPYHNCWFIWIGEIPKRLRPRCGAWTRRGTQCIARVVPGKNRCRMHGGLSTGPKTEEGRKAIAESNRRRAEEKRRQRLVESAVGIDTPQLEKLDF